MTTKKRTLWKIGGLFLFIVLVQVLFDPFSEMLRLAERLQARQYIPTARQKWEAQGITHYRFNIRGYVPLTCMFGDGIEVKDGVVIHGEASDAGEPDAMLHPGFAGTDDPPLCNYQNYTMPGLFRLIEEWLAESPASITEISFDSRYGFISSFSFGNPGGHGILNPTISDCCGGFSIENFEVLGE
jgi:hypothetical protein